jgi:glycine/D-amino acid oxidase-like deaminating enzyme
MGIAAAIGALERGFEVTVLEAEEVGASLRRWGRTRFFSPFAMNVSPVMAKSLDGTRPPDDALLTGAEFADLVLRPLVDGGPLHGRVRTRTRVVGIGRRNLQREDYAGHPLRAERPFRLLVATEDGEETLEAEIVLDATGGYRIAKPFGAGGLPARGELGLRRAPIRDLEELEKRADALRGKRVLLIGHGHSAANALEVLGEAEVTWAVRTANRRPCEEVANDPLPERQRVVSRANALAESGAVRVERKAMVESIAERNGVYEIMMTGGRRIEVEEIAAFTGYRPDTSIVGELAVETSPVTEGGARLYRAISNVTDCLAVPHVAPQDLQSGEPNFYFVGSRSYGRSRAFLLRTGLQQLETILNGLPR